MENKERNLYEHLGLLLSEWCLNSPTEEFFRKINKEVSFFGADDHARLRFNYVIANTAIVIIALNEYFGASSKPFVDVFLEVFLRESKRHHKINVLVGDFLRNEAEIKQIERVFIPPKGTSIANVQMNLHELIEVTQEIRLEAYFDAYEESRGNDPLGPMGRFAYIFVRYFYGDIAFDDPVSTGPMMAMLLNPVFVSDCQGLIDNFSKMK